MFSLNWKTTLVGHRARHSFDMAPSPLSPSQIVNEQELFLSSEENHSREAGVKNLTDDRNSETSLNTNQDKRIEQPIKWGNVIFFSLIHIWGVYSLTYLPYIRWQTWISILFLWHWVAFGVTGGAHRLWTHRSYKASLTLRIILMLAYSTAGMNNIYDWVRDHRVHHKYSETDADPHNAKRGLFFSHVGWLLMKKHPEVIRRGKQVNMDDILNDPVCTYNLKHHYQLLVFFCLFLPTVIPVVCWQESWSCAVAVTISRWVAVMNGVWSVNSFAHLFGGKPFNKHIYPAQNKVVSFLTLGEGWHNYHHVFPWDYKTSETGFLNTTMHLIRLSCALGLASDLKTASPDLIKRVVQRYGDGTHPDWTESAPEVPEEAADDISVVDTLPPPNFHKQD